MKSFVRKLDAAEVQRAYPIADRVPGWFFRLREVSNGCWLAEGTDLWGRQVSDTGGDEQELLASVIAAAHRINQQLSGGVVWSTP